MNLHPRNREILFNWPEVRARYRRRPVHQSVVEVKYILDTTLSVGLYCLEPGISISLIKLAHIDCDQYV